MNAIASDRLLEFIEAQRKWVVIGILSSLYAVLMTDFQSLAAKAFLVTHFGLFLLWQPFLSTDRKLDFSTALILFIVGGVLLVTLSGWGITIWLALLVAIMGGRVFIVRMKRQRLFYLIALLYLLILLLTWTVPKLIIGQVNTDVDFLPKLGLPVLLIMLVIIRLEEVDKEENQVIDFFYSLLLFQLVIFLVLGSIAIMRYTGDQYFFALFICVLGFGLGLFALAFLWSPPVGYGGIRAYFSRYLMSVGVPSELWLRRLAEISEKEDSPSEFLKQSLIELKKLPWVIGGEWKSPDGQGEFGTKTDNSNQFSAHVLRFTLFTNARLSPALILHMRLLVQLLGEFYEGKRREQALRLNAYMQAVHETGAKLTHDIKNVLQSLYAIASAGQDSQIMNDANFTRMLGRQLPELTKRLQITLDKLRSPQKEIGLYMPAAKWWEDLKLRYEGRNIIFLNDELESVSVLSSLFDGVAENCIENARYKRLKEVDIEITVYFRSKPQPMLCISDTGSPISSERIAVLFNRPFEETNGMGIGLYQAYHQAQNGGYLLKVGNNKLGNVEFILEKVKDNSPI
jgi:signal transduction histidine kinase